MDKILVSIPSLSRPEYLSKKTMSWLKSCGVEYRIFVEPQEEFLYRYYNGDNIVTLPESGQGLMYSLNFARKYAKSAGFKYIFQLDDDVDGFVRADCGEKDYPEAFLKTFEDCYSAMERFDMLGGIRFSQYRFWLYSKKKLCKWTHYNRPLQGICMLRTDALREIDSKMSEYTDTVTSLYLWKDGYITLNYGLAGLKVNQNANRGGCQTRDRRKDGIETIEHLKDDFPAVKAKKGSSWFAVDVDISPYLEEYGYRTINGDDLKLENILKSVTKKFCKKDINS